MQILYVCIYNVLKVSNMAKTYNKYLLRTNRCYEFVWTSIFHWDDGEALRVSPEKATSAEMERGK